MKTKSNPGDKNSPVAIAKRLLRLVGNGYPKAWRAVDQTRQQLTGPGKNTTWPSWCFITHEAAEEVMMQSSGEQSRSVEQTVLFCTMAGWRLTQGVYRFDDDVISELAATAISMDVPGSLIYRLPQWTVFVQCPTLKYDNKQMAGFFASIGYHGSASTQAWLQLVLVTQCEQTYIFCFPIREQLHEMIGANEDLSRFINLLLFVSQHKDEIRNNDNQQPENPRPVLIKKSGWRLFAQKKPVDWEVGRALGEQLRAAGIAKSCGVVAQKMKAQAVPAHWQRQSDNKYKWIPALPVAVKALSELKPYTPPTM